MKTYSKIDIILNDYRISKLFENVHDTVDSLYGYYMEGVFDIEEYEMLIKEAGDGKMSKKVADGWAIAKKYLHADVKDIPKMISDAKKQCNMRKLTDEFKIKEILRDGEKIIQDREKDRQKAIKNKKAEAKAKKKEAKKQAKVQESVMESIFSNLNNYYSEGYISESCYNKCVNMFDEWETYSYSWEL